MAYLSYSGWKKYDLCPYAYWHSYIGKTSSPKLDDRLGAIFGSTIGEMFEEFYVQKWWKKRGECQAFMIGQAEFFVDKVLKQETSPKWGRPGGVLMWRGHRDGQNPKALYNNREELVADMKEAVVRGLQIIRHYRLLGPMAEAEMILDVEENGDKIAGRADFVMQRTKPYHDLILVDGKGSRHRGKYVDPRQLHWYAMLYRMRYGRVPDKLAFLYWKFAPPESIDWVEFSEDDLDQLHEEVLASFRSIKDFRRQLPKGGDVMTMQALARDLFRPKPNSDNCRFCQYATKMTCPSGAGFGPKT
jgi:PD-(D/E)XK nuclease superfamily